MQVFFYFTCTAGLTELGVEQLWSRPMH